MRIQEPSNTVNSQPHLSLFTYVISYDLIVPAFLIICPYLFFSLFVFFFRYASAGVIQLRRSRLQPQFSQRARVPSESPVRDAHPLPHVKAGAEMGRS